MIKSILIIAPHPDDEVLGCGGVISKLSTAGCKVFVAVVTHGHLGAPELFKKEGTERVRKEAKEAHAYLGVQETIFLDFPVLPLQVNPSYKLSGKIAELIKKYSIDTLYIPHRGDIHNDHAACFTAALVAARPINNCPVKRIYVYETLSETEWAAPFGNDTFIPTVFEDISDFIEHKLRSFSFFTTQLKDYPHPRSLDAIKNLSMYRGATVGYRHAEAFMLVREIKA